MASNQDDDARRDAPPAGGPGTEDKDSGKAAGQAKPTQSGTGQAGDANTGEVAVTGTAAAGKGRRKSATGAAAPVEVKAAEAGSGEPQGNEQKTARAAKTKREPATRATSATRARAAERADPRTGTRKTKAPRKADDGGASQTDAPASANMTADAASAPAETPHVSEVDAPASAHMTTGASPAAAAESPHVSEVEAPASEHMTVETGAEAPEKGARPPHVSEVEAPASRNMSARIAVPDRADTGQRPSLVALPERIAENIQRIEDLGQRLVQALAQKPVRPAGIEGPGMDFYAAAAGGWMKLATEQPARLIGQQVQYWGETLQNIAEAQTAFLQRGGGAPEAEEVERDKRFKNPLWQTNPFFAYVREQYRINADALSRAAADLPIDDIVQRRRIDWFTRQMIDMMAPTNFLGTNPDALAKAIETEGESLVRGLENLVADIEHHQGDLVVSLSDRSAFAVGENIGATPGAVVHRDPMFELIQYTPTTEQVHKVPLLIIPPWINKFYILDLKPQNSMIRWLVEQGYTLFVVSWKNPGADESDVGMEDYVSAYLSAFEKVRELTGERQLNAVGYCIAGTTLSLALGLLSQRGDDQVRSATFFTTLTDFSDQGEFTAYLQDDFVTGIEEEVARTGYLSARLMQRTFSFLRANDLVWGPAVRHYMMGETPPAFDLLHWNGDGTNLPARMLREYLRNICQANQLVRDGFEVLGHTVRLSDVKVPLCAVACETDHIAPWVHSWRGVSEMGSDDKTFLLSESGHIAGIINPPGRDKYGHYIAHTDGDGAEVETAEGWKAKATFRKGSWWPEWEEWLAQYSGPMVRARPPGSGIEPAPGSYVREQA